MSKISNIALNHAYEKMAANFSPKVESETILTSEAYGRILVHDQISDFNIPPMQMSHYDGYAVRSVDTVSATAQSPLALNLKGRIRLGQISNPRLNPGETWSIPTGGLLPDEADAVVMKEAAEVGDSSIKIRAPVKTGINIVSAGDDIRKGEMLLPKLSVLRAQDIALLPRIGKSNVEVARKPIVGILSTGSELVERVEELQPGRQMATHAHMLSQAIVENGALPVNLGIAPDDKEIIRSKILQGLQKVDILLTTGGSSVGAEDFTAEAVNSLGQPGMIFRGIQVHPGRMAGFGVIEGKPVVMVPGLVQAAIVVYYFLTYPLVRRMLGMEEGEGFGFLEGIPTVHATMTDSVIDYFYFKKFNSYRKVLFIRLRRDGRDILASPLLGDTSLVSIVVNSSGWTIVPEGQTNVERGQEVEVYLPPGFSRFS